MKQRHGNDMSVQEQAAQWLCDLQEADEATRAQFTHWLKASPLHIQAFLELEALWNEMDRVDAKRAIDIDELLKTHEPHAIASNVVALPSRVDESRAPRQPSRWRQAATVAAVALLALIGAWTVPSLLGKQTYVTAVGEQRTLKLSDGSVIHLNTDSRVEVRYTESARDLRLIEGEALFSVERDPARPFRVSASTSVIQAIGTQFNVYNRADGTSVAVIEGVVKILPPNALEPARARRESHPERNSAPALEQSCSMLATQSVPGSNTVEACELQLAAGETAYVAKSGSVEKAPASNIEEAIAWKQRRLVFRSDTLADVADEFNRYNRTKIRIDGDALKTRRLIGTFNADDPESLALFLSQDESVAVERSGSEIVIRAPTLR